MKKKVNFGTKVIHAGTSKPKQGGAFNSPPVFASTFHLSGQPESAEFQYGRFDNPTWKTLENSLADLEGAETIVFPSGMAAIAAILSSLIVSGQTVILPSDGYFATRAYVQEFLVPNGINLKLVPTTKLLEQDYSKVSLILVESPSNPLLDVVDIQALSNKVHNTSSAILAIDNTTMTIKGQDPLALGADISVSADTKALNGHSDVLFGHVSCKKQATLERMRLWRKLSGNIPGPMETWLVQRGMATLDLRLERMTNNALEIASLLQQHPNVNWIRYPGLAEDPSHYVAKKQMANFGFIISFDLGSEEKARTFLQASSFLFEATSFGGLHTMAERRARWGTDNVPEGLIRLSVGCEDINDLKEAISSALNSL